MAHHTDLGQKGEDLALKFLTEKGFRIKERNWRYDRAEIDLIAVHSQQIVFIEVKTRSAVIFEEPRDSISEQKIRLLVHAAEAYLLEKEIDLEARFDVVSIKWFGNEKYEIEHIEDAFTPPVS